MRNFEEAANWYRLAADQARLSQAGARVERLTAPEVSDASIWMMRAGFGFY